MRRHLTKNHHSFIHSSSTGGIVRLSLSPPMSPFQQQHRQQDPSETLSSASQFMRKGVYSDCSPQHHDDVDFSQHQQRRLQLIPQILGCRRCVQYYSTTRNNHSNSCSSPHLRETLGNYYLRTSRWHGLSSLLLFATGCVVYFFKNEITKLFFHSSEDDDMDGDEDINRHPLNNTTAVQVLEDSFASYWHKAHGEFRSIEDFLLSNCNKSQTVKSEKKEAGKEERRENLVGDEEKRIQCIQDLHKKAGQINHSFLHRLISWLNLEEEEKRKNIKKQDVNFYMISKEEKENGGGGNENSSLAYADFSTVMEHLVRDWGNPILGANEIIKTTTTGHETGLCSSPYDNMLNAVEEYLWQRERQEAKGGEELHDGKGEGKTKEENEKNNHDDGVLRILIPGVGAGRIVFDVMHRLNQLYQQQEKGEKCSSYQQEHAEKILSSHHQYIPASSLHHVEIEATETSRVLLCFLKSLLVFSKSQKQKQCTQNGDVVDGEICSHNSWATTFPIYPWAHVFNDSFGVLPSSLSSSVTTPLPHDQYDAVKIHLPTHFFPNGKKKQEEQQSASSQRPPLTFSLIFSNRNIFERGRKQIEGEEAARKDDDNNNNSADIKSKKKQNKQKDIILTSYLMDAVATTTTSPHHPSSVITLPQALSKIDDNLKSNGLWVNMGPLTYHDHRQKPKLSYCDILFGFFVNEEKKYRILKSSSSSSLVKLEEEEEENENKEERVNSSNPVMADIFLDSANKNKCSRKKQGEGGEVFKKYFGVLEKPVAYARPLDGGALNSAVYRPAFSAVVKP